MNGIMRGIDALKATQRPSSDLHTLGFTRSITLSMLFGTRRHRNTETCFFFKTFLMSPICTYFIMQTEH